VTRLQTQRIRWNIGDKKLWILIKTRGSTIKEPTSGDYSGYECSECESVNTVFEEYASSNPLNDYMAAVSELGIICEDCSHQEDPDELNKRFEPTEPDE
jgi:hypothetical protein